MADDDGDGKLSRSQTLELLVHAGLSQEAIEQILLMTSDDGCVTISQFTVTLRLVAMAQVREGVLFDESLDASPKLYRLAAAPATRCASMPVFVGLGDYIARRTGSVDPQHTRPVGDTESGRTAPLSPLWCRPPLSSSSGTSPRGPADGVLSAQPSSLASYPIGAPDCASDAIAGLTRAPSSSCASAFADAASGSGSSSTALPLSALSAALDGAPSPGQCSLASSRRSSSGARPPPWQAPAAAAGSAGGVAGGSAGHSHSHVIVHAALAAAAPAPPRPVASAAAETTREAPPAAAVGCWGSPIRSGAAPSRGGLQPRPPAGTMPPARPPSMRKRLGRMLKNAVL